VWGRFSVCHEFEAENPTQGFVSQKRTRKSQADEFMRKADTSGHIEFLIFLIKESVHDLLPQFRKKQGRCRDY